MAESMTPVTIALGVPHTPWIEARAASMARLRSELGNRPKFYREFSDRAPNRTWALEMWRWGLSTGAEFFLTLQDDVMVAPFFWPSLRAMLEHLPHGATLGLTSVHPMGREVDRRGHRWFRTCSWHVGWAYGMWRQDLLEFVRWAETDVSDRSEDDLVNAWHVETKRFAWHPVPSIVDHDTSIASSYANDHHSHRRPAVSWRGFREADLTSPDYWRPSGTPEAFPFVPSNACCLCLRNRGAVMGESGLKVCPTCIGNGAQALMARMVAG